MLYYLQTTCVMIAMIHIWVQPYTDDLLNAFDGILLLALVLVVNTNTFTFLSSVTSTIVFILILFPLIFLYSKKLISYIMSRRLRQYEQLHGVDDEYYDDVSNYRNNKKVPYDYGYLIVRNNLLYFNAIV